MRCPRCPAPMQEHVLAAHHGRSVSIDLCQPCQCLWFDAHESVSLSPGATLALFRLIGERAARVDIALADAVRCPRCQTRLQRTHDRQRNTRFEYFRCPAGHGRLTSFLDFLREKNFIRPLTSQQLADLRQHLQAVNCSGCGAAVDLAAGTACGHCGTTLSVLDLGQAETLVRQLQQAEDRRTGEVDPALALNLARARRQAESAFSGLSADAGWADAVASDGLIGAGLAALQRWLRTP